MFTGIEEFKPQIGIHIYPNPASNSIRIFKDELNTDDRSYTLTIYNPDGRVVSQRKHFNMQYEMEISFLSSGIYTVLLTDDFGISTLEKLAIVRK